jgi:hypothetical protein
VNFLAGSRGALLAVAAVSVLLAIYGFFPMRPAKI